MQGRGRKKSLFIGRTQGLVEDGKPLLYPRYTDITEVLLEGSKAPATAVAKVSSAAATPANVQAKGQGETEHAANGDTPVSAEAGSGKKKRDRQRDEAEIAERKLKKQRKKQKLTEEREQRRVADSSQQQLSLEAGQPDAALDNDAKDKGKKDKKKKEQDPIPVTSGPGNAKEAVSIRNVLGITSSKSGPAVVKKTFTFGFGDTGPADEHATNGDVADKPSTMDDTPAPIAPPESEEEPARPGRQPGAQTATALEPAAAVAAMEAPKSEVERRLQEKLRRVLGEGAGPGPQGEEGGFVPRRVFVGGMPFALEEAEVREYWEYCGALEAVDLMRFPDTGRFKGIAFITFATEEGYKAALECNGAEVDGHTLRVERCKSAGPKGSGRKSGAADKQPHQNAAPKVPGYHVAYVGNLAFEAGEPELRGLFEGLEVTRVRLHTEKGTGQSKGFAHVHFGDEASLDRAVELSGTDVLGRAIKIGYAQPKKTD